MLAQRPQRKLTGAAKHAIRDVLRDEAWHLDAGALAADIVLVLEHVEGPIEKACEKGGA